MNAKTKQSTFGSLGLAWRVALICAVLFSGRGVSAQVVFKPFSADMVKTMGKKTTMGKAYAIENALRVEGEEKGKSSISIMPFDRKLMWVLMPDQKMYMEMPWQGLTEVASIMQGAEIQRDSLGSEQVGAYHCDKSRVQTTYEGKTYTTTKWAAKELDGFVVKRQDEKGEWWQEYRNIHLGPQDPSLFAIPAGYQKMDLGGMFKPR
jgi:hypothetical protein